MEELCQINKSETDDNEKECDRKRKQLKEKYKNYTDIYFNPNVYTDMTLENIKKLGIENSPNAKSVAEDGEKYKGRKFKLYNGTICTLLGTVVAIDDYYWLGKRDDNGKEVFISCAGGLDFIINNG